MPPFAKNFPEYAQSSFENLCNVADLTKNRSIQDREGWDYIVEFPRAKVAGLPHDRQPGNATVRVQVKSKTSGKPTASIKLSNALRFASEPDPCFIALWWRTSDHSEERIYAKHFDKPLLEATLRRAREAHRDGKMDLNRLRLSITFDNSDDHTNDLVSWIRSIADTDQHDYANRKRQLTDELGFEGGRIGGTLKLPYGDVQKLIDAAVGLPTTPPDVEISLGDRRFDIVSPFFEGKPTVFNFEAIPKPGQLTFRNDRGRAATFIGEVRSLAWGDLSLETVRATFKSPGISGIVRGREFKISYDFRADDIHPLDLLQNLVCFMVISEDQCSVALSLDEQDEPLKTTCPPVVIEDREGLVWLDKVLGHLRRCCGANENPPLRAMDLIAAHDDLVNFAIACAPGTPTFDFETNRDISLPLVSNLIGYRLVQIGGFSFFGVFRRACLEQSVVGRKIHLRFNDAVELEAGMLAMDDEAARKVVERRFIELASRVGTGALIMNRGDYLSLLRKEGPLIEIL